MDPYHLTLIDGDWYLFGHCHIRGEIRIFTTVRVRKAEETGDVFHRPADFRVDAHVGSGFRMVSGGARHRIALRFVPTAAGRAAEKIWWNRLDPNRESKPVPGAAEFDRLHSQNVGGSLYLGPGVC